MSVFNGPNTVFTTSSIIDGQTELYDRNGYAGHVEETIVPGCFDVYDAAGHRIGTADKSIIDGQLNLNINEQQGFTYTDIAENNVANINNNDWNIFNF